MSVDASTLQNALQEQLRALTHGDARIENLKLLAGGASQETWALDLFLENGEPRGEYALVLRRQLGGKIYPDALDLAREFRVMQIAYASDVWLPYPQAFLPALLGRPAALLHRKEGETIGRKIVRDPALQAVRAKLPAQMGAMLARIHRIDIDAHHMRLFLPQPISTERTPFRSPAAENAAAENAAAENAAAENAAAENAAARARHIPSPAQWILAQLKKNLDEIGEPHPALELGLRWLERHEPPAPRKLTFCHGDYRIGNVVVNENGLVSVLDWEFGHIGDPYEDLAWPLVRDWRFGNDAMRFGGVAQPDEFFAAYEKESGVTLDADAVHYWQVMGNLRWAVGMLNQAQRHLRGQEPNLEFASLGRRCAEVELEALHLVQ